MATIYVSKSGSNVNNGSTYLLSKLTIQAAIIAATTGDSIIVGSGIYNEKLSYPSSVNLTLTIYCDGTVILDGTGIILNPAIYIPGGTVTQRLNILPHTTGGQLIIQNHIALTLISLINDNGVPASTNMTNVILLSNSNATCIGVITSYGNVSTNSTFINCVFSGFTTTFSFLNGSTNGSVMNFINCTFYNGTTAITETLATNLTISISQCIFSGFTTSWNIAVAGVIASINNNLYYNVTNYKVGASTYVNQSQVQAAGYDLNSLWQNPNFVDAANNVFYLTSNPNVTNNAYLYYGAYPYGLTRGNVYNPDNKWLITGSFDNSGWYNPDGNITMVSSLFQLTTGATGVIWSPVYDLTSSQTISQFNVDALQVWGTNMVDTTKTDVRPNYQTSEIRASATSFNQNDGVIAWTELKNRIPFTTQGSTNLTGRYVQLRLTLRNDDVAA